MFCVEHREMNHVKPDHAPMPAITEAVSSQRLLAAEDALAVRTAAFVTSPFFHVSRPQRLSPLASIPAIKRISQAAFAAKVGDDRTARRLVKVKQIKRVRGLLNRY